MPFDQVRRRAMGIRRKDVAPFDPLILVMGLFARSLFPASALRRAIACIVPRTQFEYLRIPLTVTATDLDSGELLLLGGPERRGSELDRPGGISSWRTPSTPRVRCRSTSRHSKRMAGGSVTAGSEPCCRSVQRARSSRTPTCLSPSMSVRASTSAADPLPTAISRNHPTLPFPRGIPRVVRTHGEAMRIMMAEQAERTLADWPKDGPRLIYVRPVAEREATFAVERVQEYVEMGYQATKKALG